jgi:hypothetical protein
MATTAKGYPYPVGTDRVMDGDDAIHSLATAVETMLGVAAAGQAVVPIVAANTAASITVVLPAGRFTAGTLAGNATAFGSQPDNFRVTVGVLNTTQLVIWGLRTTGTATFAVSWSVQQI